MTLQALRLAAAAVALAALSPALAGCAEDDVEREAAYPETVGYSTPPSTPSEAPAPPPQRRASRTARAPAPPPPEEAEADDAPAGNDDAYDDTDPSALEDFRPALDPYGNWVEDPTYGTAWVPSQTVVGGGFTPYVSAGHWAYDNDYTWVSDYSWGWAPFHYGRWVYAGLYGWEWLPGRAYAGAWVSWRAGYGDWGYVGWAPLAPTWGWRGGVACGLGFVPSAPYAFASTGALFSPSIGSHVITGAQAGVVAANTRPYVSATPSVGGRVAATPSVSGPTPQSMRIPASAVAHATTNRGVAQAIAYSRPSTAAALGARSSGPSTAATASAGPRVPSYGSATASHFGGKLGYGFAGSASNARPSYGQPSFYGSHGTSNYSRGYGGYSAAHGGPVVQGSSGHHSGESYDGGQYSPGHGSSHGGGYSGYSSGFHGYSGGGGGGYSSGGFHSGGGGGGRGGGGHR